MTSMNLMSVSQLAGRLDEAGVRVFDVRHDLGDFAAGRRQFEASHIAGAHFLDNERELAGAHTGATAAIRCRIAAGWRICWPPMASGRKRWWWATTPAARQFAAHLWWLLRWIGHDRVAVLDGGWQSVDGGRPARRKRTGPRASRGRQRIAAPVPGGSGQCRRRTGQSAQQGVYRGRCPRGGPLSRRSRTHRSGGWPHTGRTEPAIHRQPGRRRPVRSLRRNYARNSRPSWATAPLRPSCTNVGSEYYSVGQSVRDGSRRIERFAAVPGSWSEWISDPSRPREKG